MTTREVRRISLNGPEFLGSGLNVTDNPLIVPPTEMVESTNILIGSTLARKKRGGQDYLNTDSSDALASYPLNPKNNGGTDGDPILGLYEFWRYDSGSGAPKSTLMVRQGTKIWAISSRTGVAVDLTGALTLPSTGEVTFQAFEGKLYWASTNTLEGYNTWDGVAGAATAATVPPDGTPSTIIAHGGRMWAFGVPGFPYRIYYSEFYDGQAWATTPFGQTGTAAEAGSLDLDPFGDPLGITGAVSFQDRLYVYLKRASFEITGNTINNFIVKTISRQIGCIGHRTIVPIANDIIYASERGILRMSSTDKAIESEYGFISRPISRIWNENIDRELGGQFSATYDEQENLYLLSCATKGSTENDVILAFNAQATLWAGTWEGIRARTLATYVVEGKNRVIAGREDGVISLTGTPGRLDLGFPYTSKFKTGILYPNGEMDIQFIWKTATVLASTNGDATVTFNAFVDTEQKATRTIQIASGKDLLGSTFILGQSKLGNGVFVPQTMSLKGSGYGLQLEVIFNTEDEVEVYGFFASAIEADQKIGATV